ncbi:MAG: endonuclease/exonuclease/phosphatase family protein, partial [Pseudomonadota bacterium]
MTEIAPLTVVTWNINSIRARIDLFAKMVRKVKPDVILLQETRVDNGSFPLTTMRRRGYKHAALNGRGGHHGVAILSKVPLLDAQIDQVADIDQPRHVSAVVDHG